VPKAFKGNFLKLSNAFMVKKFYADIDTGDFPMNAQLMPLTLLSNNSTINLNINFENRNTVDIEIFTRLYKILATWVSNK